MSADITLPAGAPEEVVTNALVREVDLSAFGGKGVMALITLDNGLDHNRPNTFGAQSVMALDAAITDAIGRNPAAIAITGKPFIFAAGADLSALSFLSDRSQSLAIGKLGHDVFRRLGESKIPTFAFINRFSSWWRSRSRFALPLPHIGIDRLYRFARSFPWTCSRMGWRDNLA